MAVVRDKFESFNAAPSPFGLGNNSPAPKPGEVASPRSSFMQVALPPVPSAKIVVEADFDAPTTIQEMAARRRALAKKIGEPRVDVDLPHMR